MTEPGCAELSALDRSFATVVYAADGTILRANARFLALFGYSAGEVIGRQHAMFVPADELSGPAYEGLWAALKRGEPRSDEYRRLRKDGSSIWIQATYMPVIDSGTGLSEIVAFATDVTTTRVKAACDRGEIEAIRKSQAVVTFDMDGIVVEANDLFLEAMGYRLEEVEGRHHRMFVDPSYVHGLDYAKFWSDLREGRHQAAEYRRFGKNGREVWLQATYNPVFDTNGQPRQIIKYATVVTREKLRQADHQGQIASIHKSQCVISFNMDGTILDANDNFLALTGYRLAQLRGRHHRLLVDDATAASPDYAALWSDLARGHHHAAEYKRICRDGREIWLQATYNPIFDMNGRPFKVVKYATDITQERLRQTDDAGQVAAIHKSQCVVAFDMDGIVTTANENFLQAMGYHQDEVLGRHHSMFVPAELAASDQYAAFWETLRKGSFLSAKFKRIGKDDREVWIQASYNPILDLNGRPFKVVKIATDITADVALAADLSHARRQAEHDMTTGLPNRLRLFSFMSSILGRPNARLAILYLDLDHFKPVNDIFGHHVGDHVLVETANRLRQAIAKDQIVSRVGGDEFVVAAPDLLDDEIVELCDRLITAVKVPIKHDKGTVAVGLSIGVSVSPNDALTADELLRRADVALYRSKGNGRGAYSFYASDSDQIAGDRHLAENMLHGIKAGEFFLEYQPRFDARTRTLHSVEALVRWDHPERGRIEPEDFMHLAENSGLIMPLGEWILRTASQAATQWAGIGLSVNVSPVQFRSIDLMETVGEILAATKLDARSLELGISEGTLLEDEERAYSALTALKGLGVRLAMDDFREGSSSLTHLRRFPFDTIKFDQRFIVGLGEKEAGRAMIQAVQGLGQALDAAATATGIKTTGHHLLLSLDDSSEVQGFLVAAPISAAEISALLTQEPMLLAAAG